MCMLITAFLDMCREINDGIKILWMLVLRFLQKSNGALALIHFYDSCEHTYIVLGSQFYSLVFKNFHFKYQSFIFDSS